MPNEAATVVFRPLALPPVVQGDKHIVAILKVIAAMEAGEELVLGHHCRHAAHGGSVAGLRVVRLDQRAHRHFADLHVVAGKANVEDLPQHAIAPSGVPPEFRRRNLVYGHRPQHGL